MSGQHGSTVCAHGRTASGDRWSGSAKQCTYVLYLYDAWLWAGGALAVARSIRAGHAHMSKARGGRARENTWRTSSIATLPSGSCHQGVSPFQQAVHANQGISPFKAVHATKYITACSAMAGPRRCYGAWLAPVHWRKCASATIGRRMLI
jgi:hypothetical protein